MRRMVVLVSLVMFPVAGCVTYSEKPLIPAAELVQLRVVDLTDLAEIRRTGPEHGLRLDAGPFDPSDGLDERELVAFGLAASPELRERRLEIGGAEALLIQASLWPNPEIGFGMQPGIGGTPGFQLDTELLFELLKPWERSARIESASARIEEVRAEIVAQEWRLVREVRLQHLEVRLLEAKRTLIQEEVALRERALVLVRQQRDAGVGTELEVSATELELANTRREALAIETEIGSARRELNRLLGLPPSFALRLAESERPLAVAVFDDVSDDDLERRVLEGRFELRGLESAYARAEHELRLAVYRQLPILRTGPSYSLESEGPERDHYLGPAFSIEIPIFDRNQGEIAEKENQRERARAAYVSTVHRLRAEAYEARDLLRRARIEVDAQEKDVLPLVRRNQDLYDRALEAREIEVFDWILAQERAVEARRTYLETLVRYERAVIEVEAATGTFLAGGPSDLGK